MITSLDLLPTVTIVLVLVVSSLLNTLVPRYTLTPLYKL